MEPMPSIACTPEEKLHRRRVRQWKRRARIAGPFIGITILLAALALSVGLIEYQPRENPNRLSDRPIRLSTRTITQRSDSLVGDSIASSVSVVSERAAEIDSDMHTLDLTLPSTPVARVPTPPEAIR
jgi:hypothetical protein